MQTISQYFNILYKHWNRFGSLLLSELDSFIAVKDNPIIM